MALCLTMWQKAEMRSSLISPYWYIVILPNSPSVFFPNSLYTPSKACLFVSPVLCFMWRCRDCGTTLTKWSDLLKHYKLIHRHYWTRPWTYLNCACKFKTWNSLLSHLSRNHAAQQALSKAVSTFTCHVCGHNQLSIEREYFQHIYQHFKNKETVTCVPNSEFTTNVYENLKSHKYRKHSGTVNTSKPGINSVEEFWASVVTVIFQMWKL